MNEWETLSERERGKECAGKEFGQALGTVFAEYCSWAVRVWTHETGTEMGAVAVYALESTRGRLVRPEALDAHKKCI